MMKLENLIPETMNRMKNLDQEKVMTFLRRGKEEHWYVDNYEKWAVFQLRAATWKVPEICDSYRQYGCDDTHWFTLIRHCARKMGWL